MISARRVRGRGGGDCSLYLATEAAGYSLGSGTRGAVPLWYWWAGREPRRSQHWRPVEGGRPRWPLPPGTPCCPPAHWHQYSNLHYYVLNCSAVQCSAVQCSAVQCSAVQCSAVQCSAVQGININLSATPAPLGTATRTPTQRALSSPLGWDRLQ